MGFKENILKKMEIDSLSGQVNRSIGPSGSGQKIDKDAMRRLLDMGGYDYQQERDLVIYRLNGPNEPGRLLVLDNELAIYNTTIADVGMRKSPTVKEMISIRNIIKILNDSDVIVSKREDSVKTIQQGCIDQLDLDFEASDLDMLEKEGVASLEMKYSDGVIESLTVFAELLDFEAAAKPYQMSHHVVYGCYATQPDGAKAFGPFVVYSLIHNTLVLIEEPVGIHDRERLKLLPQITAGDKQADRSGSDVFAYLKSESLAKHQK